MMPTMRQIVVDGRNFGVIYTFEKAGDVLPVHVHETNESNHLTFVLHGRLEYFGDEKNQGVIIEAVPGGKALAWPLGQPHGFRALTDGATIYNQMIVPHG